MVSCLLYRNCGRTDSQLFPDGASGHPKSRIARVYRYSRMIARLAPETLMERVDKSCDSSVALDAVASDMHAPFCSPVIVRESTRNVCAAPATEISRRTNDLAPSALARS